MGHVVGAYRIEREIATGGMGTVFVATHRTIKRRVALKLLRPETLGPARVRRFSMEIEVLGRLHHPNIAEIYEGGSATFGTVHVPFFAMELVPNAEPVDTYVTRKNVRIEKRLRLFTKICRAVNHAHLAGVIHRDLKPANILVDGSAGSAEPKVIDFGIARLADHSETATRAGAAGTILGSLETMSPEQVGAAEDGVDIRTDVYALGVMLYRMLTGTPPLETSGLPVHEAIRVILEEAPPPPSRHRRGVRPELDAIVLKCLSKHRSRRYDSVRALQDDVEAYLDGRTVSARAPSSSEILRRTLRRHRRVVLPLGLVFVIAIVAAVLSVRWAVQAGERADEINRLAYQTTMNAAATALSEAEFSAAQRFLDDAPAELRGWEWEHLSSRLSSPSRLVARVDAPFERAALHKTLALSPDGQQFALFSTTDSLLRIYDADTGALVSSKGPFEYPMLVTFESATHVLMKLKGPDRARIVRVATDGGQTSERVAPAAIFHLAEPSRTGAHTPRHGGLIAQTGGGGLSIFGVADNRILHEEPLFGQQMDAVFDRDAERLAVGQRSENGDFIVVIYEVTSWRRVATLSGPKDALNSLAFSADGGSIVAASADGGVYRWDIMASSEPVRIYRRSGEPSEFIALSDDGRLLAATDADSKLRFWDFTSGEPLGAFGFDGSRGGGIAFRPGTRTLYTAGSDFAVRAWDIPAEDPSRLTEHASYVYPVEISQRHGLVVSGGWDGYVGRTGCLKWTDLETGDAVASIGPRGAVVLDAVLAPDESEVLVTIYTPEPEHGTSAGLEDTDRRSLAAAPGCGLVARVSMQTGEVLATYEYPETINFLAVDPSYRRAVLSDRAGLLRVVELESGGVLHRFGEEFGEARDRAPVAWSEDGRWIAAVLAQDCVQILDASTFDVVTELRGHEDWIWSVSFDAAGERLLTASNDQSVGVWSIPDGALLARLEGHGAGVLCARFHPDGTRIATGVRGGAAWFWRTDDYAPVTSIHLHDAYIYDMAWTDDGRTLVTSSGDGTVRAWSTEPAHLRVRARAERREIARRLASADTGTGGAREAEIRWQEALRQRIEHRVSAPDAPHR